ncbi:hypothetical protein FQN50_003441 [Emmonsiellopsis sp. PD_5]|nr:hypothetical protein FQN50_003441 [Emmonsiellopsis sp. PD_5]
MARYKSLRTWLAAVIDIKCLQSFQTPFVRTADSETPNQWDASQPPEPEEAARAAAKRQALYDAGVPFFTKETFQDLSRQFKMTPAEREGKFSVTGLDGRIVEFQDLTGTTPISYVDGSGNDVEFRGHENPLSEELEYVMHTPELCYTAMQQIDRWASSKSQLLYCNLMVMVSLAVRNKLTKEIIPVAVTPLEEVQERLKTKSLAWEASEACKELRSVLASARIPSGVSKIVAFACGTLNGGYDDNRTATQHAALLTIRDVLQKNSENPDEIKCYAQDPDYNDADKAVLEGAGISVLDDPCGFTEVDDSSVVLSICPDIPVQQVLSDIARPAMVILDRIREEEPPDGGEYPATTLSSNPSIPLTWEALY